MTEPTSSEAPEMTSTSPQAPSPRAEMIARALLMTFIYSVVAIVVVRSSYPWLNGDIWWQMNVGRWILQHHAFPQVDMLSRLSPSPPWHAYSWLYDISMYMVFRGFQMAGALAYITAMILLIFAALHRMTSRLQPDFIKAILVAVAGILCLMPLYTPRTWLFSILFFVIQLDLLHRARSTGSWKILLWLLPLYALWANLHIQFIDGLVVLGATACEPLLMRFWPWPETPRLPAGKLFAILGGCIAATFVNPYGWSLYHTAYKLVSEKDVFNQIQELGSIPFRMWQNFLFLALVVAASAVLARRKKPDLWRWMLLAGGLIISFRSLRDIWFLMAIAVMILAEELPSKPSELRPLPKLVRRLIAVVVLLVAFGSARIMGIGNPSLNKLKSLVMPVKATDVVLERLYQGPLFNTYNWGGYLAWRTGMRVSIDPRAALFGGKRYMRSLNTWRGEPDWASNPDLKTANLVIGPVNDGLTQLLRQDPAFRLVYEDNVAAVFVRKTPIKASSGK